MFPTLHFLTYNSSNSFWKLLKSGKESLSIMRPMRYAFINIPRQLEVQIVSLYTADAEEAGIHCLSCSPELSFCAQYFYERVLQITLGKKRTN